MAIKITVGSKQPPEPPKPDPIAEVELQIRRTANGDYYISDHADIDIIVMKNKVLTIAKDIMSEMVYGAQDRLFSFLVKKGLVAAESIQGGSIYGSMEGTLLSSDDLNVVNMTILNVSKYIDEERPYFEFVEKFDEMETEYFTEPEEEDSTELGEVPQEVEQGSIRKGYVRDPYSIGYMYTV